MVQIDDERMRLLVRVATLYYSGGRNQEEVAAELKLSRPKISRLLAQAQAAGVVQISIHDPFSSKTDLERRLEERFGLREAVVSSSSADASAVRASVAVAAAGLMERLVRDGFSIGVNGGVSLSDTCDAVRSSPLPASEVVPLVGGWGPSGARWQANLSSRTLAQRLGCSYLQLNAPAFVSSVSAKRALVEEDEIRMVLARGTSCDLAVVGVGQLSRTSTLFKTGFLTPAHLRELEEAGAVANICNSFIDADGRLVPFSGYERMVGLSIADLSQVPAIFGVAAGADKVAAIVGALRGRWLSHFATNADTAEAVLALDAQLSPPSA